MKIFARPENTRVEEREMLWLRVRAISMGKSVPRSPREPEISEMGERMRVERLCWWIFRRKRGVERRWEARAVRGRTRRRGEGGGKLDML